MLASFTPLVLSATGGWAREASVSYKRLASLLSNKWGPTIQLYHELADMHVFSLFLKYN